MSTYRRRHNFLEVQDGVFRDADFHGPVVYVNGPVPENVELPSRREPSRVDRLIREGKCTYVESRACTVSGAAREKTCHRNGVCMREE